MGREIQFLWTVLVALAGSLCAAQTTVEVSDPVIQLVGNTIHITYDILHSTPQDKFNIELAITDENGNAIDAKALSGDIGENVSGGSNKQITWDLEADHIYLDEYILVQINAYAIQPPVPAAIPRESEKVQEEQETGTEGKTLTQEPSPLKPSKTYNRTGIILQSVALPGLGLSRVTGKPHWLRGVAGYGCIAGSVILNRQAVKNNDQIEDLVYYDDIQQAYNKSLQQDNISEILAYAAIGIWVTDIIWNIAGTKDLHKASYSAEAAGFSIGSKIDAYTRAPLISVTYRF
jgi:hypothetical protein